MVRSMATSSAHARFVPGWLPRCQPPGSAPTRPDWRSESLQRFAMVLLGIAALSACKPPFAAGRFQVRDVGKSWDVVPWAGQFIELDIVLPESFECAELYAETRMLGRITQAPISIGGIGEFGVRNGRNTMRAKIWILDSERSLFALRREGGDPDQFLLFLSRTKFEDTTYGGARATIPKSAFPMDGLQAASIPPKFDLTKTLVPIWILANSRNNSMTGGGYSQDDTGKVTFDPTCDHLTIYLCPYLHRKDQGRSDGDEASASSEDDIGLRSISVLLSERCL